MTERIDKSVSAEEYDLFKLIEQTSDPSNEGDRGFIYTKDVSGSTELFYRNSGGTITQLTALGLAKAFPAGTKMVFYQSSAPTGFTLDSSINDRALLAVNSAGGTLGGSWTISGLNSGSHALTINEMPSHDHIEGMHARGDPAGSQAGAYGVAISNIFGRINEHGQNRTDTLRNFTSDTGGGAAHSHSISQDGSWRPLHAKVIICTQN